MSSIEREKDKQKDKFIDKQENKKTDRKMDSFSKKVCNRTKQFANITR